MISRLPAGLNERSTIFPGELPGCKLAIQIVGVVAVVAVGYMPALLLIP
jgi:hypothetical protein